MKVAKIIFGLITFGVFIYLFFSVFVEKKDKILCGDRGIISNFNLSEMIPTDFCDKNKIENRTKNLLIASTTISIEIASSSEQMMRGLSGRMSLEDGKGMLFIFNDLGNHGFWMKEMYFPIDIIFINENFDVVGIKKSLLTSTYPEIFGEEFVSKYVLEVPAGFVDKNQIKVGDRANLTQ
jgi:hypothetical protein